MATLTTDDTAYVDSTGALFYAEPAVPTDTPLEGQRRGSRAVPVPADVPPAQQTRRHTEDLPRLRRRDDLGHAVAGGVPGIPDPFVAAPFTIDASPSFSIAELDRIQSIWQRGCRGLCAIRRRCHDGRPGLRSDQSRLDATESFGTRVLITDSPSFSPISSTGIAYIGTIDAVGAVFDRTNRLGSSRTA